jgi:hypothetical protein
MNDERPEGGLRMVLLVVEGNHLYRSVQDLLIDQTRMWLEVEPKGQQAEEKVLEEILRRP